MLRRAAVARTAQGIQECGISHSGPGAWDALEGGYMHRCRRAVPPSLMYYMHPDRGDGFCSVCVLNASSLEESLEFRGSEASTLFLIKHGLAL
jgi:hypothetical protein